ncbi:alpha-glucosidase [Plakobranchus ocellatus]|uniref:Alpha-glucosidase n=1 Tax=Plakobranchus ocellatus TaxID=259542 RepID=A0AAV3Z912_9GAST|nr:alpha-glucosidase [Plakobranchus ocellatus]
MARLFLLLALSISSVCSFDVKDSPTGFTVSIGSFILLDHTRESPILFVGSGDLSITEDSGNFFINSKIFSRVPMYTYALSQDANDWLVDLTEGDFSVSLIVNVIVF